MSATWEGSFTVGQLLQDVLAGELPRPPEHNGVYAVTEFAWSGAPTTGARVLYVGTTTGRSRRFRTRIGDLMADLFGFYGTETRHHSGGQKLHEYCMTNELHPFDLHIGWLPDVPSRTGFETHYYDTLKPLLNQKRPPQVDADD